MKKVTYGQQAFDHHAKQLTLDDDIIEYRRQMEKDIGANIQKVITEALVQPQYTNRDFYIVLLMKVEKIGQAPRTYVFARQSCPTPIYKQSVWKYHHFGGNLEFLWSIPDAVLYNHIFAHPSRYINEKETADLAKYVLLMQSGELLDWIKKENGEKLDVMIHVKEEYV